MRILIIGASGRTGTLVVSEALDRGHKVTALVRNPSSLPSRENLTIIKGTPLNEDDITTAFLATKYDLPQAVITTLNAPRETDSPFSKPLAPPRFMADSAANVRSVMKRHGVKKLVIMSAFGVGDSFKGLNFLMRPIITHTNMSAQFKDHNLVDAETKESRLDWVLVRPVMLKGEAALPVKMLGNTGKEGGFMPSISRKSVAGFLMDAVEKNTWNRSTPVVCN
jgi:putative NADH-flavin reductase